MSSLSLSDVEPPATVGPFAFLFTFPSGMNQASCDCSLVGLRAMVERLSNRMDQDIGDGDPVGGRVKGLDRQLSAAFDGGALFRIFDPGEDYFVPHASVVAQVLLLSGRGVQFVSVEIPFRAFLVAVKRFSPKLIPVAFKLRNVDSTTSNRPASAPASFIGQ